MNVVTFVDNAAKYTGVFKWFLRRCTTGLTILMYHKVLPPKLISHYPLPNLVVEQSAFEQQIAWLTEHFEVLTVNNTIARLAANGTDKKTYRPLACVTFDDGYRDNFYYAAPILESYGLRGTFFVTTGFVEGTTLWFDRASIIWLTEGCKSTITRATDIATEYRELIGSVTNLDQWLGVLKRLPTETRNSVLSAFDYSSPMTEVFTPMLVEHLQQLAFYGHEIGAHSVTHPILTDLNDEALLFELEQSRTTLMNWTNQQVVGFCYPNGNNDERVVKAVCSAGYSYACTVRRGIARQNDDYMALPRRAIFSSPRYNTLEGFESEVIGCHDFLRKLKKEVSSTAASIREKLPFHLFKNSDV